MHKLQYQSARVYVDHHCRKVAFAGIGRRVTARKVVCLAKRARLTTRESILHGQVFGNLRVSANTGRLILTGHS